MNLYTKLIDDIWLYDNAIQTLVIEEFCKSYRKCDSATLLSYKPFLNLDNNYIYRVSDGELAPSTYGLYRGNTCVFNKRLVIPIRGFDDIVYGFVGYDNGNELTSEEDKINFVPYLYLNETVFKKEKYCFITREEYLLALQQQYICIVDGVFDKISLTAMGLPAVSLLGSNLSKYHREYLRYIPNWIVFSDNDLAGHKLYSVCKNYNPKTIKVSVGCGCKDIDERINLSPTETKSKLDKLINLTRLEGYIFNHSLEEF